MQKYLYFYTSSSDFNKVEIWFGSWSDNIQYPTLLYSFHLFSSLLNICCNVQMVRFWKCRSEYDESSFFSFWEIYLSDWVDLLWKSIVSTNIAYARYEAKERCWIVLNRWKKLEKRISWLPVSVFSKTTISYRRSLWHYFK